MADITFIWSQLTCPHWRCAMPPRGRGRYPRPPTRDGALPPATTLAWDLSGSSWASCEVVEQVEWALDAGDHAGGDTRVARRRIQFIVAQQRLDNSDVGATL